MSEDGGQENEVTVDDLKKVSEIGPIKALLTPAAELLGQRLKSSVEGWLERKAAENIEAHAQEVLPDARLEDVTDQAQIELYDWAEKAGRVSYKERELSATVRAALQATLSGDGADAEILMNLSKAEITFLEEPDFHRPDAFVVNSLIVKGLLEKVPWGLRLNEDLSPMAVAHRIDRKDRDVDSTAKFLAVVAIMACVAFLTFMVTEEGQEIFGLPVATSLRAMIMLIVPVGAGVLTSLFLFLPNQITLTLKGAQIREQLKKYLHARMQA